MSWTTKCIYLFPILIFSYISYLEPTDTGSALEGDPDKVLGKTPIEFLQYIYTQPETKGLAPNTQRVKEALDKLGQYNPVVFPSTGDTILHLTVFNMMGINIAADILEDHSQQVNVNVSNIYGVRPLHNVFISKHSNPEKFVQLFKQYGTPLYVNIQDRNGDTPLHTAAKHVSEWVKAMIPFMEDDPQFKHLTPEKLTEKYIGSFYNGVNYLLKYGANPALANNAGDLPVDIASRVGNLRLLRTLFNHVFIGDIPNKKPLYHIDVYYGKTGDPNPAILDSNRTPLHILLEKQYTEYAEQLIETYKTEIDINRLDNLQKTPLYVAVENNQDAIVDKICNTYPDVHINSPSELNGKTPLHIAVENDNTQITSVLLHHGADPYITDFKGYSPWYTAYDEQKQDILNMFRQYSDIKTKIDKLTSLVQAAQNNEVATVETYLKEHPDAPNPVLKKREDTLLHIAAYHDAHDVINLLTKHNNLDINVSNRFGETALHTAMKSQKASHLAVQALLFIDSDTSRPHPYIDPQKRKDLPYGKAPIHSGLHPQKLKALLQHPKTDPNIVTNVVEYPFRGKLLTQLQSLIARIDDVQDDPDIEEPDKQPRINRYISCIHILLDDPRTQIREIKIQPDHPAAKYVIPYQIRSLLRDMTQSLQYMYQKLSTP